MEEKASSSSATTPGSVERETGSPTTRIGCAHDHDPDTSTIVASTTHRVDVKCIRNRCEDRRDITIKLITLVRMQYRR
ncbi:hypothetical protein L917_00274 [Phytophthora nicotianae]|uniref:Uncharacterized protein n=1 Tax=Phytophthora nicotianae TaxID=4792 RepID=W2M3V0_PHYNI|nr:hypothetical protein L917_00274 [Phytophthora nicotianae]